MSTPDRIRERLADVTPAQFLVRLLRAVRAWRRPVPPPAPPPDAVTGAIRAGVARAEESPHA